MRKQQRGVTLILGLIMLVLLTIMALSSFNIGKSSLQIVDNAQQQNQALNAAQSILDRVISNPSFVDSPNAVLLGTACPSSVSAPANSDCIDLYGDGKTVVVVAMDPAPVCTHAQAIPSANLDFSKSEDLGCTVQEQQNHGVEGLTSGDSLCSESQWELNALASEQVSRAQARVTQGVGMRVSTDAISTACP
jgi:Tfp pilus assembly protein PilV